MAYWRIGALATLCLSVPVSAVALTASEAVEIAKKNCAKQVGSDHALNWTADQIDGLWAVSALPKESDELESGDIKGWIYVIPPKGPFPKACERYTILRTVGVKP